MDRSEREREGREMDFEFEMEAAQVLGDTDRRDLALLDRFPELRPYDLSVHGAWDDDRLEMLNLTDYPVPSCMAGSDCDEDCWLSENEEGR